MKINSILAKNHIKKTRFTLSYNLQKEPRKTVLANRCSEICSQKKYLKNTCNFTKNKLPQRSPSKLTDVNIDHIAKVFMGVKTSFRNQFALMKTNTFFI